jgi:hypothetical protein
MSEIKQHDMSEALAALMKAGDARSLKAVSESARGRELKKVGADRQAKLARDHAWSLHNQADGLWEAAAIVRELQYSVSDSSTTKENN